MSVTPGNTGSAGDAGRPAAGMQPSPTDAQLFLLVARFSASPPAGVLELLSAQPSCLRLRFVRATDPADDGSRPWTLVAEFAGAAAYRAALSPFDVRTTVIPWLATALPGSGVGEASFSANAGVALTHRPTVTP